LKPYITSVLMPILHYTCQENLHATKRCRQLKFRNTINNKIDHHYIHIRVLEMNVKTGKWMGSNYYKNCSSRMSYKNYITSYSQKYIFRTNTKHPLVIPNPIFWELTKTIFLHQILLGWLSQRGWGGWDMWLTWGMGEVFTGFWSEDLKVRDHWVNLRVGGRITLSRTLGR
jgi:hypothetical protein